MENNFNKLQIRAKVLSVLSDLKMSSSLTQVQFLEAVSVLKGINDNDALFEIILKELSKSQGETTVIIKAMLVELLPPEMLKNNIFALLPSKIITDQTKYDLIQVLREVGGTIDYDNFFNYFSDPDSILDYDTQKLLEFAIVNPETQIDFLDFLTALPLPDKMTLINSLSEDYAGDNLANILSPIVYSDFDTPVLKRTIEILGETKSSIAFHPIKWAYENLDDESLVSMAKKNLSKLKLSGASEKKAKSFYKFILSESKIDKCYTTIPDGHSNQGVLVTRVRQDGSIQMFALVVNNLFGIVDCFGFNSLSPNELERIVTRFCKSDDKIEVTPKYCKMLIDKAISATKQAKEKLSYEFVCWSLLLKDVERAEYDLYEWAKINLKQIELLKTDLDSLYSEPYLDRWFFTPSDNNGFKEFIDDVMSKADLEYSYIEEKISAYYDKIWSEETVNYFNFNLVNTAYLIYKSGDIKNANILYSVLLSEEIKSQMQLEMIRKSVYEYMISTKQNLKEVVFSTNIFRVNKEKKEQKIDIKKIDDIIKYIETEWVK